jgi:ABC-2 type transport system ATP-binding protein
MGRKEIRDIIIEERNRGKTIFFSSHILSDIEHLCDRVAIVVKGVLRREGMLSDLLESERRQSEMVVQGMNEATRSMVENTAVSVVSLGASTHKIVVNVDQAAEVMTAILSGGGRVEQVQPYRDSLESLFLRETEGS